MFIAGLYIAFFPFFVLCLVSRPLNYVKSKTFDKKYGTLTKEVFKKKTMYQRAYYVLFVFNRLILTFLIIVSCGTGKLKLLGSINNSLKEVSASELVKGSDLAWVIEDNGNKDHLYGLTFDGKIKSSINIKNAKNEDWEDLTSDNEGNIYIGDFGNNRKKRKDFTIYKILHKDLIKDNAVATQIEFKLPKKEKSKDFEAFFLLNDHFYIFSKERTNTHVYKIPNKEGKHEAELVTKYKFDSKNIPMILETPDTVSYQEQICLLIS